MLTTVEHPRLGEVVLSQSRRARRISISVRGTGCVRLSFPYGVSARRAMEFLERKAGWVEAARARLAQRRAALPPQLPPAEEKARIEELRRAAKADLPRPYRADLPHYGAEVQQTDDPCLAYEVG